jgi:hypothetical protein
MMGATTMSDTPHPLQSVVWNAFAENDHQDGGSLAYFLAGAIVRDDHGAYRTVALDVLLYMESQGLLTRDRQGWWRKVTCAKGDRSDD